MDFSHEAIRLFVDDSEEPELCFLCWANFPFPNSGLTTNCRKSSVYVVSTLWPLLYITAIAMKMNWPFRVYLSTSFAGIFFLTEVCKLGAIWNQLHGIFKLCLIQKVRPYMTCDFGFKVYYRALTLVMHTITVCSQTSCAVLSYCLTECTCARESTFFVYKIVARATNQKRIVLTTNSIRVCITHYLHFGTWITEVENRSSRDIWE